MKTQIKIQAELYLSKLIFISGTYDKPSRGFWMPHDPSVDELLVHKHSL